MRIRLKDMEKSELEEMITAVESVIDATMKRKGEHQTRGEYTVYYGMNIVRDGLYMLLKAK